MDPLDQRARELYEADPRAVKPTWDQLGDATRSVWREYVEHGKRPEDWQRPGWA